IEQGLSRTVSGGFALRALPCGRRLRRRAARYAVVEIPRRSHRPRSIRTRRPEPRFRPRRSGGHSLGAARLALRAAAAPPCHPLRGGRNSAALASAPVHPHAAPRAKVPAPEVGGAFTRRCAPRPAGGGCAAVPPATRVVEPGGGSHPAPLRTHRK